MKREIKYDGELDLNGFKIPCYVLEDGTRVLSGRAMQSALKMVDEVEEGKQVAGTRLTRYLNQKTLKEFIFKGKELDHFEPVICYKGNSKIHGYEATILADICDGFLEARKHINLSPRQEIIATQAETLIRAFARVGIIALVDEATGYLKDKNRAKDEFQKFLKQFMREDAAKLVKRFEDSFFEMIYKMRGWTWNYAHKHPGVVGIWINDIVYERVAPLVLTELRKKNPVTEKGIRKNKHHQFLSDEIGVPKLLNHLAAIEALGRASGYDWNRFMEMVDRAFPKQYQQLDFIFDTPPKNLEAASQQEDLSDFNQKLKTALDYKPEKKEM